MSLTDAEGRISQPVNGTGDFVVTFSAVGKALGQKSISLSGQGTKDLGRVLLHEDANTLGEVQIQAQKPLVKMQTDKLEYDVQSDVDSKSSTVLDLLRKVPMVTVDGQDNITVNGSSSFKVYVDGKPNPMMSNNASRVFKAMPASMVKKIEVVTNPGAKYDAEGAVGILELTMNKIQGQGGQSTDGYTGNIEIGGNDMNLSPSAFVSVQKGKFSLSANGTYQYQYLDNINMDNQRTQETSLGTAHVNTSSHFSQHQQFGMGSLSMGYDIDSLSSLSSQVSFMGWSQREKMPTTTEMYGGYYGTGFAYNGYSKSRPLDQDLDVSADYKRFLNADRSRSVTLSYLFTYSPSNSDSYRYYTPTTGDATVDLTDQYSRNHGRTQEHTFQADYTTPLGSENQTLSTGVKYIYRRLNTDSRLFTLGDNDEQTYMADASSIYRYINHIAAAYVEASNTFGKFSSKAGLRYEHTWQDVAYRLGNGSNFSKDYGNLVPSVSLTYNLAPTQNIGLSYNMRISRPGIDYLNPYVDKESPTSISYGNTLLDVEKNHNIGLVFNSFTQKFVLNATLRYSFSNNGIREYSFYDDNIMNTTYGNIVKSKRTRLNVYSNWTATKSTRIIFNGSLAYNDFRSSQLDQKAHGWTAHGMVGLQQDLPWKFKLSANFMASTKRYNLQGWGSGFRGCFGTLSRSFADDKFNIALQGFAGLNRHGHIIIKQFSHGNDFQNRTKIDVGVSHFGLKFTYNFGNLKGKVKSYESNIKNDFMESEKDNQQGNTMGTGM
jgi:outer membrane receptor protein involved in Fe transport